VKWIGYSMVAWEILLVLWRCSVEGSMVGGKTLRYTALQKSRSLVNAANFILLEGLVSYCSVSAGNNV